VATAPSVSVVKSFLFKGGTRLFSNRYHFSGGTPADAAHWHTLMDAVTTAEKAALYANSTIVEAIGYAAGSEVPVASKVYALAGTHTGTGGNEAPGEAAALVRYSTAERTTKNHPIYLFNYYHNALLTTSGASGQDKLLASQAASFLTYANAWITGFSDGTNTYHRCGPNSQLALGAIVEEWLTHRDFPYTTSV
jgi:hypothetical protein